MKRGYKIKSNRQNQGFTLFEVLIVLGIIVAIMGLVVTSLGGKRDQANVQQAKIGVGTISGTILTFRTDVKRFPKSLDELVTRPDDAKVWLGPYIQSEDQLYDPWGNQYQYRQPGQHGTYDVYSFGADGVEGGQDFNADIGNWE